MLKLHTATSSPPKSRLRPGPPLLVAIVGALLLTAGCADETVTLQGSDDPHRLISDQGSAPEGPPNVMGGNLLLVVQDCTGQPTGDPAVTLHPTNEHQRANMLDPFGFPDQPGQYYWQDLIVGSYDLEVEGLPERQRIIVEPGGDTTHEVALDC